MRPERVSKKLLRTVQKTTMVRKHFTETPVEEPTEEVEEPPHDSVPEESNVEEESQIEQPPVKPKTIKQLQKEAENVRKSRLRWI